MEFPPDGDGAGPYRRRQRHGLPLRPSLADCPIQLVTASAKGRSVNGAPRAQMSQQKTASSHSDPAAAGRTQRPVRHWRAIFAFFAGLFAVVTFDGAVHAESAVQRSGRLTIHARQPDPLTLRLDSRHHPTRTATPQGSIPEPLVQVCLMRLVPLR